MKKPTKPKRQIVHQRIQILNGTSLQDIFQIIPNTVDLNLCTISNDVEFEWNDYDDCYILRSNLYIAYDYLENEESFNQRMESYKKELAKYNKSTKKEKKK